MVKKFFLSLLLFVCVAGVVTAQEFKPSITVNYDQLPLDQREEIMSMQQDVLNYVSNQRFTGRDWEGPKIPVDITIFITGRSGNSYSGRLLMVTKRTLDDSATASSVLMKIFDDKWMFPYARYANLSYQPMRYDEFTSLIDFYLLIALGLDADSYGELDGTPYFEKARQIAQMGINQGVQGFSQYFQPGELTRYSIVSDLTDMRFEEFRRQIFAYHVDAMELMQRDRAKGVAMLDAVLSDMLNFRQNRTSSQSAFLQIFFDAKSNELADIFKGNEKVLSKMTLLDPLHASIYNEAANKK